MVLNNELWWLRAGEGAHGNEPVAPDAVIDSLRGSLRFVEENEHGAGLRAPQLGALHAILAHRSKETGEPITVVMPTGTGKTETMLAAFCHSPSRTLAVVPSDALRRQIADKFATLGVPPEVGAVTGDFLCPSVLTLSSGLATVEQVDEAVGQANVVVATVQALSSCGDEARARLAELCDRLFVDEAHHVAAKTWQSTVDLFRGKEVIQFTATPYREDGQHLGGSIAYAYPLRLAQKNGYFARISYHSVTDFADPDRALAAAAVAQLRADLEDGRDHLLMARVSSVARARSVIGIYEELAADLKPIRIDNSLAESSKQRNRRALVDRASRIVVCVNMLGEGFDLPALKVAAIHDPQKKSLAVTLQFIGRFTRVGGDTLGEASAFVPLQVAGIDDRLRRLFGEDADWNQVIQDLTEHEVGLEKERSDFEMAFGQLPREVALRSVHPKMSTLVYRSTGTIEWEPDRIYDLFEGRLLTTRLGLNAANRVAWWVSEEEMPVRWSDVADLAELVHHLYVVHLDAEGGFLYVNSTDTESLHEDIAKAIGGEGLELLRGNEVFRVLSRVQRRVPTNVGLLDAVSRSRRFSLHVGQDVLADWRGEGATKTKTNIFAHGFKDGRSVSFGASRKGRVWSHEEARDVHDWLMWAREIGPTIADESIPLASVMDGFLLPEEAKERPPHVPLAVEWPHELIATLSETRRLEHRGLGLSFLEADVRLSGHAADGPLAFEVTTPAWSLAYQFEFHEGEVPSFRPTGDDAFVRTAKGTEGLAAFLGRNGLLVTFENEAVLTLGGYLLRPDRERHLFPAGSVQTIDWTGVDIRRESQGMSRTPGTVQHRAIEVLCAEEDWEVVLDDDGPGELADVVFMKRTDDGLDFLIAHCKFSSEDQPGARIEDLYDVCGQAMKMNRAKALPELLTGRLMTRERKRQSDGRTGLVVGDESTLASFVREARMRKSRATVAIIQPGISKARASVEQLALLGATERFLTETYGMRLRVIGSE